jgi:hypothetical protein
MPALLNRSREDMLAAMAGQFGVRWPNSWWPTGNAAYDDCAACVSYFLFGLNSSRNPFYSYVSQLQNYFAAQGRRTWGNKGIQRGDVLAFSWSKDANSFDHTEVALGPVSPAGLITSRGTNSNPGDDMRDRTRSAAYVVSYSRPAYPGTTSAGTDGATLIQEDDLSAQAEQQINAIFQAIFDGGTSMPDRGRSIGASLAGIVQSLDKVNLTVTQPVHRGDKQIPQIQDNADTNTMVRNLTGQIGALQQVVATLATTQGLDPATLTAVIEKAAQKGAADALAGITLKAVTE